MRASQSCGNFNQRDPLFYDFPPFFSIYNMYGKGEKFKTAIVRVTKLIEAVNFLIFSLLSSLLTKMHSSLHSFLIFLSYNCQCCCRFCVYCFSFFTLLLSFPSILPYSIYLSILFPSSFFSSYTFLISFISHLSPYRYATTLL